MISKLVLISVLLVFSVNNNVRAKPSVNEYSSVNSNINDQNKVSTIRNNLIESLFDWNVVYAVQFIWLNKIVHLD